MTLATSTEADQDRSNWEFGFSLPPSRRRAGYIVLDQSVPSPATTLRVEFNVSESVDEYPDEADESFFTIRVPTDVRGAPKG